MNASRLATIVGMLVASVALVAAAHASAVQHGAPASTGNSSHVAGAAADTLMLSLADAIAMAIEHGIDMRLANAEISIARGRIRQEAAAAWPQVTGAVDYTRRFDSIFRDAGGAGADTIFGPLLRNSSFAAENSWSLDVTLSQLLFSRRVGAAVGGARAYRKLTEAKRAQTSADVALEVHQAYLTAAAAQQLLAIAEAGLDQARGHFNQVQLYRKQGTRAEYDLIRAQVDAMNAEPPVVASRNDYELAVLDLERLLGLPFGRALRLTSPVSFDAAAVPVAEVEALAPAERQALVAATAEVEGRRRLLDLERAARWPELKVSGTVSHQAFPGDVLPDRDQFRRNIEGSARLEFPLFLGLRTFGAIQRAQAELDQAEARRDQLQQTVDLEVARARQDVRRTLAVMLARNGTVQLTQRAHHLATVRYSNGLSTQLEVSDARLQMLSAEGNAVLAARDYRVALARLEHALGRPVPVALRPIDQLSLTISDTKDTAGAAPTAEPRGSR